MPNLRRTLQQLAFVHPGDVLAVNVDFAGVGGDEADQVLEQNALAAAAHADDGDRLPFLDGEIHAVQDAEGAEALLQIADVNHHRSRVLRSMVKKKLEMRMAMEE